MGRFTSAAVNIAKLPDCYPAVPAVTREADEDSKALIEAGVQRLGKNIKRGLAKVSNRFICMHKNV